MTKIKLYLGAHKTATTHLQGILLGNRAELLAGGVTLSAPQDVRKSWLPGFFKAQKLLVETGQIPDEVAAPLRELMPKRGNWILTEENIIGIPADLARQPGIYPLAGARVKTLRHLFPEAELKFYFSVRSYDSFYRSMYSEVIRNRGFMPFGAFYNTKRFARNSWLTMMAEVAEVIAPENIVLWRFEDFRAVMPQALARLTDRDDTDEMTARYAPETTRPSLSQKTVDILSDLAPAIGVREALRLTEMINRHYAVADGHTPLSVFDAATTARLQQKYAEDMAEIALRFPSLVVLEPK